jgi:hypothetical protein
MVSGYELDDRGSISFRNRCFSPRHHVQTGSYVPGVKWADRKSGHRPSSGAEVMNVWCYISTAPYIFMVWCLSAGITLLSYHIRNSHRLSVTASKLHELTVPYSVYVQNHSTISGGLPHSSHRGKIL